jgi:nitrile hydratase
MALMVAVSLTGVWNVDEARSVLETLPEYAALGYYERWFKCLEKLTVDHGLLHPEEIATASSLHPARPVPRVLLAGEVSAVLADGGTTRRPATTSARFSIGDRVRTRLAMVEHHTRLPSYARGKAGLIERINGVHVFPDAHSRGWGEQPQWLYTVVFSGAELWGEEKSQNIYVSIDAWEPYLERLE